MIQTNTATCNGFLFWFLLHDGNIWNKDYMRILNWPIETPLTVDWVLIGKFKGISTRRLIFSSYSRESAEYVAYNVINQGSIC